MARAARRQTGSFAAELRHPLSMWQREVHSAAAVTQARLLLTDIAGERARAGAVELTVDAEHQPQDKQELRQTVAQWRAVAAGVAVGDGACLLALARGLANERSYGRLGDDCLDAALTALALAVRSGSAPERIVACIELLLMLPEVIGKSPTTARRARGLASLFRVFRTFRWTVSGRNEKDQNRSLSTMMSAIATVEAVAIRRGLFVADLNCEALLGHMTDLLAAVPLTAGNDGGDEGELSNEGCKTDLPSSTRRIRLDGVGLGAELPAGSLDQGLSVVPFPKFDAGRLSDNRRALADRYAVLTTPLPLTPVGSRQEMDRALQSLATEMPNFRSVIERIIDELALARCTASRAALRLSPMLLVGPPGVGKTRFASRLAACLGLPWGCLALAGSSDSRELAGTARGWSSAHPSWPVEQLVQHRSANPLLVIDEIDKAGGSESNGRAVMSLLTLLERRTSQFFNDECLGGPVDLSLISWILTANSTTGLPGPLLSRLTVMSVQAPATEQVGALLATMTREIAAERDLADPRMLPALPQAAIDRLSAGYAVHGDPRRLRAELTRVLGIAARADELWAACPASNLH